MAIYRMCPVIDIDVLENEITAQFDIDVVGDLRNILFMKII